MGVPKGLTFTLKRAEGSLHGEGCLQDVQTARLRIAGAPISIHILGSWSPYAPNGTFRDHLKWTIFPSTSGTSPMPTGGQVLFDTLVSNIISFYATWAHRFTICLAPFPN